MRSASVGRAACKLDRPSGGTTIYTFGLEEEFFVVNPATRDVVARVPPGFVASCRRRLGRERVSHEMLQSQVEIVSPVFADHAAARSEMRRLRDGVAAAAGEMRLAIVASGTHPLGLWNVQKTTRAARYERLVDDFQIIGRRNLLCGLHIHVGVAPGVDRVDLMNRLMPWLPCFLALSTSSPFWNRHRTGLLSYRQAAYDEWPRTGIPDFLDDEADYAAFVDLLVRTRAIDGPGSIWWAIRPSHRFPTLELRIADCCTDLDDALALAALFRCLVRAHVRRPRIGRARGSATRRLIEENRWRAKRHGIDAAFIDEARGEAIPFREVLADLLGLIEEDATALGCAREIAHIDTVLERGTSAHRQLAVYRRGIDEGRTRLESLRAVVDWLIRIGTPAVA